MKIAINGIGRIGRSVLRVALNKNIEIVAINDLMDINLAAYLIKYDTTRGMLERDVEVIDKNTLKIGENIINYSQEKNPLNIPFDEADVVLECTGKFLSSNLAKGHLKGNVKKVIISAPANDNTPTYVLGVNYREYKGENIISNASCTTNCLGPVAKIIDEKFGIKKGFMSTIHSYTMDQKLLDAPNIRDIRRSRAAAENIIPTFTGAAKAIYKVLPNLKGKLDGVSVRVPVANVSLMDLTLELNRETTKEEINEVIKFHSLTDLKGILEVDEEYKVSSDINSNPASSIVALDLTKVNLNLVKIFSWYDNEWGYSNRMIEMAEYIYKW
ncbi:MULTISPECIES: type I glyceraldehyde-3-phosphate dehydrogenase [unclassified Lebetimonas]|uniref:type I glyceraldehyde-3-phosphate dehydrogenase n=1 Tax=unclassified Lebetimonas TaxID=2648158 RepID=UPI000463BDCE|nr:MULTISPECIES: type I glyceraldehyde-3-phosphate dehydrogenase [unclassified Lebetimonas]